MIDDTTYQVDDSAPTAAAFPDECSFASMRDRIDASCEREALAIERLDELAPAKRGTRKLSRVLMDTLATEALNPEARAKRIDRYPLQAALRCNEKIEANYRARLKFEPAPFPALFTCINGKGARDITTRGDRARTALNRERKRLLLTSLKRHPAEYIPFTLACRLAAIGSRTLCRGMQQGHVRRQIINREVYVYVADVCSYAATRRRGCIPITEADLRAARSA